MSNDELAAKTRAMGANMLATARLKRSLIRFMSTAVEHSQDAQDLANWVTGVGQSLETYNDEKEEKAKKKKHSPKKNKSRARSSGQELRYCSEECLVQLSKTTRRKLHYTMLSMI